MLEVYLNHVAPKERISNAWRNTAAYGGGDDGRAKMKRIGALIASYECILFEVMRRHLDDGLDVWAAVDAVEAMRIPKGEWKFTPQLPAHDHDTKARCKTMLLDESFATRTLDARATTSSSSISSAFTAVVSPVHAASPVPVRSTAPVDGVVRYLALDPSLSCGWALLHVSASRLVSVDVGVFSIEGTTDGARCLCLQEQLRSLLTPAPVHAFIESYHVHAQQGVLVNVKLRAAIEMLLTSRLIEYSEIAPQSWRAHIGVPTKGDKATLKDTTKKKLETMFGSSFPRELPVSNDMRPFRHDASDAVGIGICGVEKSDGKLSLSIPLKIDAPTCSTKRPASSSASPRKRRLTGDSASAAVAAAAAAAIQKSLLCTMD